MITDRLLDEPPPDAVVIRPRTLVVGVGCVRGATADEIEDLMVQTFAQHRLALASVAGLATIDAKADEAGLATLAERRGWPLKLYRAEELNQVPGLASVSAHALRAVGAVGVCEPAALLAADAPALVVGKTATQRVTIAVARRTFRSMAGKLSVVGIGPGSPADLTGRARAALQAADVVVGYQAYVDLVRPWLGEKEYRASAIGEEVARAQTAIDLARAGRRVALISSGDAGIFGMAGLALELLADQPAEADRVDVIPGITAAQAAAAILGAPLMSDFATISLSDLMTPWPVIARRLCAIGEADLVVALYNPTSSRRRHRFREAVEILRRYRPPTTPVGIVRNATRPGEHATITDLAHLLETPVDMLTVVVVGNRATTRIGNRLVTRRGYPIADQEGRCDGL
jgi:cobalt-precorrin 5A hydrolase/precorrin-3B C17-methyltransferase